MKPITPQNIPPREGEFYTLNIALCVVWKELAEAQSGSSEKNHDQLLMIKGTKCVCVGGELRCKVNGGDGEKKLNGQEKPFYLAIFFHSFM